MTVLNSQRHSIIICRHNFLFVDSQSFNGQCDKQRLLDTQYFNIYSIHNLQRETKRGFGYPTFLEACYIEIIL